MFGWLDSRGFHRTAFFVKARRPVHLRKRLAEQEFSASTVEHIEHTVAVRPQHGLARATFEVDVGEHRDLRGVPIELVMRGELVVPFQLAGVSVESDDGAGIKVIAFAGVAIPVGASVTCAPICKVGIGIVGASDPNGGSAVLPGIASPSFVARLARTGHGIESPGALPAVGVISIDKSPHAVFAARDADDDLVLHHQRGDREYVSLTIIRCFDIPDDIAGHPIERQYVRVESCHE